MSRAPFEKVTDRKRSPKSRSRRKPDADFDRPAGPAASAPVVACLVFLALAVGVAFLAVGVAGSVGESWASRSSLQW